MREQIGNASKLIPNFGSIAIHDLVSDTTNIHPDQKREVGIRLSNLVLREVYKKTGIHVYPPAIVKVNFNKKSAIIEYDASGPLHKRGEVILGFELAGTDSIFYPAIGSLLKNNRIEVVSKQASFPVALRYCFKNTSVPNLFDGTGLPLKQFRTDNYFIN